MSRRRLKLALLWASRTLGLFRVAHHLTRRKLRILCYHGFSVGDQHLYSPILFMRGETLERRLRLMRRRGTRVLHLDEAVERLRRGAIAASEVVITIDDGWRSTLTVAAPLLARFGFPASLYVSTYYCERPAEVFNVVVQYILWKSRADTVSLRGIHPELDGDYAIRADADGIARRWIAFAERHLDWEARQRLLRSLIEAAALDADDILREQRFRLLNAEELREMHRYGIDLQLHTHRHRLSADSIDSVRGEIDENRASLLRMTRSADASHFCYPSGEYSPSHPEWLARLGILSAATCDSGLNDAATSPMLLKRYLDRDDATDLEFEAELSGFSELLRTLRRSANRATHSEA